VIAVVGSAAAGISCALALSSGGVGGELGEAVVLAMLTVWVTLSYVLCGLFAWRRRPDSRFGPLMIAAGFVNFISTLVWTTSDVPYTVGQAIDLLPPCAAPGRRRESALGGGDRRDCSVRRRGRAADEGQNLRTVDVAIVDIRLPPGHSDEGLRAALEIRSRHPGVGVLVLSQYVELGLAMKLLADSAEGVGYLLKDRIADVKEFASAVRRVAAGGSALDPIIVSTLLSTPNRRSAGPAHAARARGTPLDGAGQLEPGDCRRARDHTSGSREVRLEHLHEASPPIDWN
jgi:hypothetical protein